MMWDSVLEIGKFLLTQRTDTIKKFKELRKEIIRRPGI